VKFKTFFAALFILLSILSLKISAQWTTCQGLDGMHVSDIKIFDSTIFVCSGSNGYYYKELGEESWHSKSDIRIGVIKKTDTVLFGMSRYTFVRSFDQGDTWENIQGDYFNSRHFVTIKNSLILSRWNSVTISNDNGDSWTVIGDNLPEMEMVFVLSYDTVLFVGDNKYDSIFRSDDTGQTWESITRKGLPEYFGNEIFSIVEYNDSLWGATAEGVYVLSENNEEWISRNAGLPISNIDELYIYNDTLLCCGEKGVFYLNEGTWNVMNNGLETTDIRCLNSFNHTLFAGSKWGPFQKDGESDWFPIYEGMPHLDINSVSVFCPNIYALTGKGLFRSEDGGDSFEYLDNDSFTRCYNMISTDSLYYITSDSGFFISGDACLTWEPRNEGLDNLHPRNIAASDEYCFAGTVHGLYRAKNNELIWNKLSDLPEHINIYDVAVSDSIVVVSGYADSKYLTLTSADDGIHFDTLINYCGNLFMEDETFYGLSYYNKLITSPDGYEWYDLYYPDEGFYWSCIDIDVNREAIVIGGAKLGITYYDVFVLISYDGGENWQEVSGNLPVTIFPYVDVVAIFDNRLFAAPDKNSLWYRDDLLVGEQKERIDKETDIQIYPNPATNKVMFVTQPALQTPALISIFNMNGKLVRKTGSFSSKQEIDISTLPSGLYFIQIKKGKQVISKKLIKL